MRPDVIRSDLQGRIAEALANDEKVSLPEADLRMRLAGAALDVLVEYLKANAAFIHMAALEAPYSGFSTRFDTFDLAWVLSADRAAA